MSVWLRMLTAAITIGIAAAEAAPRDSLAASTGLRIDYPDTLGGVALRPYAEAANATTIRIAMALPYSADVALAPARGSQIDMMTTSGIVDGVFGSVAIPMRNFPVSSRWKPIYRQISACGSDGCGGAALDAVIRDAGRMDFLRKLTLVNTRVNALVKYRQDRVNFDALDHWAAPDETLSRNFGDCEDYAILKMAMLARAGVPLQSMSLVVLQDTRRQVFHAVLAVSTTSGNYILDNLRNNVLKDTALKNYVPLYSLSTDRAWIHGSRSGGDQLARLGGTFTSVAPGEGPGSLDRRAAAASLELRPTIE